MTRVAWSLASATVVLLFMGCPERRAPGHSNPVADGQRVLDPVDGARCTKGPMTESAVYDSKNHYFCSVETRMKFVADPGQYAARVRSP